MSFITSLLTAAIGIGGGLGLLSVMPSFLPMPAVVPVHGLTQFVSNASRFAFDFRNAELRFLPAYFCGASLGGALGYFFIGRVPDFYLAGLLGGFILLCTWTGLVKRLGRLLDRFLCHRLRPDLPVAIRGQRGVDLPAGAAEEGAKQGSGDRDARHADERPARFEGGCFRGRRISLHALLGAYCDDGAGVGSRLMPAASCVIVFRKRQALSCSKRALLSSPAR